MHASWSYACEVVLNNMTRAVLEIGVAGDVSGADSLSHSISSIPNLKSRCFLMR